MTHDTLWAPWRLAYVLGRREQEAVVEPEAWRPGAEHSCFLCRMASATGHEQALGVLDRTASSLVVVNRFPYASGHLLVAPLDHRASLEDLTDEQLLDLQRCLARWCRLIRSVMQAEGFNLGLNLGKVAGAGVPGHLHWHIVPRWSGDVNFMPAVAETRVLPQALESLWQQLHDAWKREDVRDG